MQAGCNRLKNEYFESKSFQRFGVESRPQNAPAFLSVFQLKLELLLSDGKKDVRMMQGRIRQRMNNYLLKRLVLKNRIEWSVHALKRMFERGISRESVKNIVSKGEMIESYPDDKPFPSGLYHGVWKDKPLHVVIANDIETEMIFVITAYWPNEDHFEGTLRTRRVQ
jgi:hypothetical protein